jgi:phosphoribosylformylglycinamidine synthase
MAQLSAAIDGIAGACIALGTPVTGGNVSLYNETKGEGIYPTPVIGIVGILDDVSKSVPSAFQKSGDTVLFISSFNGKGRDIFPEFGSTDYAKAVLNSFWGKPPDLDLQQEAALHKALAALATKGLLASASDLSDGGSAVAFAKGCFPRNLGVNISMTMPSAEPFDIVEPFNIKERLFSEIASSVIATADPAKVTEIQAVLAEHPGVWAAPLGEVTSGNYTIVINQKTIVDEPLTQLKSSYSSALESQLAAEVVG